MQELQVSFTSPGTYDILHHENMDAERSPAFQRLTETYAQLPDFLRSSVDQFFSQYEALAREGKLWQVRTRRELNALLRKESLVQLEQDSRAEDHRMEQLSEDPQWIESNKAKAIALGIDPDDKDLLPVEDMKSPIRDFLRGNSPKLIRGQEVIDVHEITQTLLDLAQFEAARTAVQVESSQIQIAMRYEGLGILSTRSWKVNGKERKTMDFLLYLGDLPKEPEERRYFEYDPAKLVVACIVPGDRRVRFIHGFYQDCTKFKPIDRTIEDLR